MHLLMFDVDGTLIRSTQYDAECFIRALSTVLGLSGIDQDLSNYEHVTDSGILDELVRRTYGRRPTQEEILLVQKQFLSELDLVLTAEPDLARPVEGAVQFMETVRETPGMAVSIATGGWGKSCREKLVRSGFPFEGIPLASADDALSRTSIMNTSLRKAEKIYKQSAFKSITYFGDGSWDLKASRELGWPFIAVGEPILSFVDRRPEFWVKDFADMDRVKNMLLQISLEYNV